MYLVMAAESGRGDQYALNSGASSWNPLRSSFRLAPARCTATSVTERRWPQLEWKQHDASNLSIESRATAYPWAPWYSVRGIAPLCAPSARSTAHGRTVRRHESLRQHTRTGHTAGGKRKKTLESSPAATVDKTRRVVPDRLLPPEDSSSASFSHPRASWPAKHQSGRKACIAPLCVESALSRAPPNPAPTPPTSTPRSARLNIIIKRPSPTSLP